MCIVELWIDHRIDRRLPAKNGGISTRRHILAVSALIHYTAGRSVNEALEFCLCDAKLQKEKMNV